MPLLNLPDEILLHIVSSEILSQTDILHLASTCGTLGSLIFRFLYSTIYIDLDPPNSIAQNAGLPMPNLPTSTLSRSDAQILEHKHLNSLVSALDVYPARSTCVRKATFNNIRMRGGCYGYLQHKDGLAVLQLISYLYSIQALDIKSTDVRTYGTPYSEHHHICGPNTGFPAAGPRLPYVHPPPPIRTPHEIWISQRMHREGGSNDPTPTQMMMCNPKTRTALRTLTIEDPSIRLSDILCLFSIHGLEHLTIIRFDINDSKNQGEMIQPSSTITSLTLERCSAPSAYLVNSLLPSLPKLKKLAWSIDHAIGAPQDRFGRYLEPIFPVVISPKEISSAFWHFRSLIAELEISVVTNCEDFDGTVMDFVDFSGLKVLKVDDKFLGSSEASGDFESFEPIWQRLPSSIESLTIFECEQTPVHINSDQVSRNEEWIRNIARHKSTHFLSMSRINKFNFSQASPGIGTALNVPLVKFLQNTKDLLNSVGINF